MNDSKVFITGFDNFDIVFVPGKNEVVSLFQSETFLLLQDVETGIDGDDAPTA